MGECSGYAVARALVDGLARNGVRVVAVGAGSRSTPAALAFLDDGRFQVFSFVDERSAGFFALGASRAGGGPAAVLTTSGTAAANLSPAAVEAQVAGVPLLLLTADRPPELHDVGAMQTIEQVGLLAPAVWATDVPCYDEVMFDHVGALAAQAVARATDAPGPVHLNLRFRDPLVPTAEQRSQEFVFSGSVEWRGGELAPQPSAVGEIAERVERSAQGLIYVGHLERATTAVAERIEQLSVASGFPVIVEATSRLRGRVPSAVDAAEAVVRSPFADSHCPEMVIRLGRAPLTRNMLRWLDASGADQVVVSPRLPWPDPGESASSVLHGEEATTCGALAAALDAPHASRWKEEWLDAGRIARAALDESLDADFFEGTIAREVVAALPEGAALVSSSSLPIRALDAFTSVSAPLDAYASRGASGIDGNTSMALGVAAATGRPTVCLTGDLAFLHDIGAMVAVARHEIPLVTVVIDNAGGGIFEFLPQGTEVERDVFEDVFATSHEMDLMHAAQLAGIRFASAHDMVELRRALDWAFTEGKSWVIRAEVRRRASVEAHRSAWSAAAAALS